MKKGKNMIAQVEDFIKRVHNGDLVILPEAKELVIEHDNGKSRSVADRLGLAMSIYQLYADLKPDSKEQTEYAFKCLDIIERARTHGLIKNQQFSKKIEDLEQENEQLKIEIASLKELNKKLAQENEELNIFVNSIGGNRFSEFNE